MADAETLLAVSWDVEAGGQQSRGVLVNVLRASDEGEFAVSSLEVSAYEHATLAARAAFRAVPGLRGE